MWKGLRVAEYEWSELKIWSGGGIGGTSVVRNVQGSRGVERLFSSPRISREEEEARKEAKNGSDNDNKTRTAASAL